MSTTSFGNTPQATDDYFSYEQAHLAEDTNGISAGRAPLTSFRPTLRERSTTARSEPAYGWIDVPVIGASDSAAAALADTDAGFTASGAMRRKTQWIWRGQLAQQAFEIFTGNNDTQRRVTKK